MNTLTLLVLSVSLELFWVFILRRVLPYDKRKILWFEVEHSTLEDPWTRSIQFVIWGLFLLKSTQEMTFYDSDDPTFWIICGWGGVIVGTLGVVVIPVRWFLKKS